MKPARIMLAVALICSGPPAFAEEVPPEACSGQNCMSENARPAETCEGADCDAPPAEGMIHCTGQDCDAIEVEPGSGPQIETVEPESSE